MSVKVSIPPTPSGKAHQEHENGHRVRVEDGHLLVEPKLVGEETIAIYAPGQWKSAVVS